MNNKEKALKFFKGFVERNGHEPNFSAIARHVGVSRQAARMYFHESPNSYLEIFPPMKKYLK